MSLDRLEGGAGGLARRARGRRPLAWFLALAGCLASPTPSAADRRSGSPAFEAPEGVDFGPYGEQLKRVVRAAWQVPEEAKRGRGGAVALHFRITRAGDMIELEVLRSRGPDSFVVAARRALEQAEPFPPLPLSGGEESVGVTWNFYYNRSEKQRERWQREVAASPRAVPAVPAPASPSPRGARTMDLGNFSVSLAVKDLAASRAFYEKLGFEAFGGDAAQGWLILRNGTATIGLFQGMFERNILTFNPGWNRKAEKLEEFTDVRQLQERLLEAGLELQVKAEDDSTGPASFVVTDPDGNPILVDQHVPKPGH